jgi:hypothetical protein
MVQLQQGFATDEMGFRGHFAQQQFTKASCPLYPRKRTSELSRAMSALCQKETFRRGEERRYSITSSASNRIELGTSMPRALAVFRLMRNSNLVDCRTGRSAGFAPLRI